MSEAETAVAAVVEAPVAKQPEAAKTPEYTLGAIIDLIGQLRLVSRQRLNLSTPIPDLPLTSVTDAGEVELSFIDRVSCDFRVWYDAPNDRRYVLLNHENGLKFTTIDEYIAVVVEDAKREIRASMTYLYEPNRIDIANELCYNPESLGLPYSEMCRTGILDDNSRARVRDLCKALDINNRTPSQVLLNSFEYSPRAETRARFIDYSVNTMPRYHILIQEILSTSNAVRRKLETRLLPVNQFDFLFPVCPYNEIRSPLDGFAVSSNMRVEMVSELTGFNMQLDSKPGSSFTKLANVSVNRPSYFTDLIGMSYSDSMASEVASYVSSFLSPGDTLINIDFSDVGASDFEYSGLLALMSRIMLMTDVESAFNNVDLTSIREADAMIVRWASYHQVIEPIPGSNDEFPLNNYRITNQPNNLVLRFLQYRNGRCGLNPPQRNYPNDDMARYYDGYARRINYAINEHDYLAFDSKGADPYEWYLYNPLKNFLRLFKHTGASYLSFFEIAMRGMIRFFVRLNDYLRTSWYTNFRNSAIDQERIDIVSMMNSAVQARVRSKTLGYLFKSFSDEELHPRYDLITRLKIESGFCNGLMEMARSFLIASNAVRDFDAMSDYPNSRLLKSIRSINTVAQYIISYLEASNELRRLSAPRIASFLHGEFGRITNPILHRVQSEMIPKGIIPSVLLRIEVNRLDEAMIRRYIRDEALYVNARDPEGAEVLTGSGIRTLIETRALASKLYSAASDSLHIRLPTPFTVTHSLSASANPSPLESRNKNDVNCSLKEQLIIKPFLLEILTFDPRHYVYADDYSPKSIQLETMWLPSQYYGRICVTLQEFIETLGNRASPVRFLCRDVYKLRSVYAVLS